MASGWRATSNDTATSIAVDSEGAGTRSRAGRLAILARFVPIHSYLSRTYKTDAVR
jgi:hypothetical protein